MTVIIDEIAVQALADSLNIDDSSARAAFLLDEVAPGWMDNVDLDRLDMLSDIDCLLAQQLGVHPFFAGCTTWREALHRLGEYLPSPLNVDDAYAYNFSHSRRDYVTLIEARRALMRSKSDVRPMTDAEDEAFRDAYERRLTGE